MTPLVFILILAHLIATVSAQVMMKHAMHEGGEKPLPARTRKLFLASSIGAMALSFFITTGLMQDFDLSYLFPFQALTVIIITLSARFFLKEQLTPRLIVGLVLISVGVTIVARS